MGNSLSTIQNLLPSWIQSLQDIIPEHVLARCSTFLNLPGVSTASKILLGIGATHTLNSILNTRALGNSGAALKWDWTREIILITGGSSGMGKMMAERFAAKGIKVVIIDIQPPQGKLPLNVSFYKADITSPDTVKDVAERIRKDVGDPTVLINNAGIGVGKSILECSRTQIQRMFDVNLISHFWMLQEFLPAMIKQNHGHIVTMASMASFVVIAGNVDYSCSKSAVLALHEGLGQELRHRYNARNIRTTVVHPYWVRTPMTTNLMAHPGFKDPIIEPEEVADAVVNQVLSGKSKQIILPARNGLISGIRGFPTWLQEFVRDSKADTLRDTVF
ncbi:hypothetical protein FALCPG4_012590 [Fusarium falciforme]